VGVGLKGRYLRLPDEFIPEGFRSMHHRGPPFLPCTDSWTPRELPPRTPISLRLAHQRPGGVRLRL